MTIVVFSLPPRQVLTSMKIFWVVLFVIVVLDEIYIESELELTALLLRENVNEAESSAILHQKTQSILFQKSSFSKN